LYNEGPHYTIIKMVKLTSSFDKSWVDINEIVTTVRNEILWGKQNQEKYELLSQTSFLFVRLSFV
jgi:hypothetical protein